jgi:hypothetical protein
LGRHSPTFEDLAASWERELIFIKDCGGIIKTRVPQEHVIIRGLTRPKEMKEIFEANAAYYLPKWKVIGVGQGKTLGNYLGWRHRFRSLKMVLLHVSNGSQRSG